MLHIGICDGNEAHRRELQRLLSLSLFDVTEYAFTQYSDGYEILEALENRTWNADLLFIDIALPRLNGLKTLSVLRQQRVETDVIILTELDKYVFEGYVYHAYDFLVKPASAKTVGKVIQRYAGEKLSSRRRYLSVLVHGCAQKVGLDNIQYFESRKRKVAAVMGREELEFYHRMDDLLEKVAPAGFVRCHQSYLINKNCVTTLLPGSVVMRNGAELPVSRMYQKQVRALFHKE